MRTGKRDDKIINRIRKRKWNIRGKLSLAIAFCMAVTALCGMTVPMQAHALEPEDAAYVEEARAALQEVVAEGDILAVVYLADEYAIRTEASADSGILLSVPSGQTVLIQDVVLNDAYEVWEYVSFYSGEQEYSGYIQREYLACSDERFLAWEEMYGMNPGTNAIATLDAEGNTVYADIEQFPASYHPALEALKAKHPNWTFVPMNTGLDWNTVILQELLGGKSLVYKSFPAYTKEGAYDSGSWYYASEDILKLYMDPRNHLTEEAIFQFEQLTYNASYHTKEALNQFLQSTFMAGDSPAPGTVMSYCDIIWAIAKEDKRQVSPFHLAARIYQEQGDGKSSLISGTYPGYEGYYNYFNVGATGKSDKEVIESGLTYAKNANPPWRDAYFSILGGADIITANYIRKGQDTLYLQKFNVNSKSPYGMYGHQYMQNISAPTTEAKSILRLYNNAGALNSAFVFKIPVYQNMPETPCPMPTSSNNVVLQIPSGYDTTIYLDGIPYTGAARNGRLIVNAGTSAAKSAVVYRYSETGVPTGMYVWTLDYQNNAYVATPQPELQDLLTYHGFSIRITGKSGIRFKTGIQTDTRAKLISEGVNGYKLKEYGTLVMNNANRDKYPMVKGGTKVLSGMSYGVNESGVLEDIIFETVDGRYRYTSVLVGVPADQYKTKFAFRGYIVLEKDGVQTIIYGPALARNIYSLAKQMLNMGIYPQGSPEDVFLQKLITDADAATP